jgi:hypothetical protein
VKLVGALAVAVVALVATGSGPSMTGKPVVTGLLQQGNKLTASPGAWSGSGAISYAFQWYRCDANGAHCNSIHGATGTSYTEVVRDVGATIGLTVEATDSSGSTPGYAALAGLVAPAAGSIVAAAQPPVTGDAVVGRAVEVTAPAWSMTGVASAYAWERCNSNGRLCTPIEGATSADYTPVAGDAGNTLVAAVTGTKGVATQTVLSLPTPAVRGAGGPQATGRPSVAGVLEQGRRLTGRSGTWLGSGPISYGFQWYRCDATGGHCSSIRGATRSGYTLVARDVGAALGLTVHATDATGTTAAYASLAGVVSASPAPLAVVTQPTIKGTATVGASLTVIAGTWTARPAATAYTWLRCNPNGRACTAIESATAVGYTPSEDDRGHTIVAAVHATARAGQAAALAVATRAVS